MSADPQRVVLVVEDNPSERDAVQRILQSNNFHVEIATDYHSAVKFMATSVPNLICLDLTLPRESGFEVCEHMQRDMRLRFVPILVMSDRASPEDMAQAEQVGANAFLKKPFTAAKLLKYVNTLLDGPHASRPSVRRLRRSDPP
jgi:DNA-binding response OmpR family regulator